MPRQKKVKLIGLGLPANLLKEFIDLSYKGNTSISPENYEIDAPLSDSRVKVYKKIGSNQVIIVHRGSVGAQDWIDNAKFLVAGKVKGTKSFNLHKERQLKAVEKYGKDNNMIGLAHSRGGLYLQELQKDPETKLNEIVTYNKAVGFYDALRTNPDEQTDVKVKNDFVSLLSGLQKRKNKMVEIEATKNPLDFNKAHQAEEIEKLGDTFIGRKDELSEAEKPMTGSGRAPSPKTLEQLNKMLKTLEGKLAKINKGKVYKTTNKEKVEYELSYTKARIKNHETKGEDLIITKKAKYGNELPAKAKAYKAKAVTPKKEEPKPEPKKEEPKPEPKKEERKKEEDIKKEDFKDMWDYHSALWFRTGRPNKGTRKDDYYNDFVNNIINLSNVENPRKITYKGFEEITNKEALSILIELRERLGNYLKTGDYGKYMRLAEVKNLLERFEKPIEEHTKYLNKKKEPKKEEPKPKKEKPIKLEERIKTIKKECSKSTTIDKNNLICVLNQDALDGALLFAKKEYKSSTSTEDLIEIINDDLKQDFGVSYVMEIDSKYGKGAHKHNKIYDRFFAGDKAIIDDFNYFIYKMYRSINKDIRPLKENPNPLQLEPAPKAPVKKIDPFNKEEPKKEEPKKEEPKKEELKTEEPVTEIDMKKLMKLFSTGGAGITQANCKEIVCKYNLYSKDDFKKWVMKNHPDKGGVVPDLIFKAINACVSKNKFCKLKQEPKMNVVELEPEKTKKKEPKKKPLLLGFKEEPKPEPKKEEPEKEEPKRGEAPFKGASKKHRNFELEFIFKEVKENLERINAFKEKMKTKGFLNYIPQNRTGYMTQVLNIIDVLGEFDISLGKGDDWRKTQQINRLKKYYRDIFNMFIRSNYPSEKRMSLSFIPLYDNELAELKTYLKKYDLKLPNLTDLFSEVKKYEADADAKAKAKLEGGIFGWSDEEKEAKKAKQEAKRAERQAKYDARKKEQNVKIGELLVSLNALKKKKQAKKEATEAPKAEAEPEHETEAVTEPVEGGIFGWSDKEKADKAERKMLREEYYKTHSRQQNANYTFDKTARANWKREFYNKNTFKKADDTMPKAVDTNEQQGIDEAEQEMLGSGMYYLKEIIKPTNPIFKYKRTFEIPTFIDPETEFLMGGAFTDMLGMNCNKEDGTCFNPTWERRKIRSQILSEYKIWYNPFAPPAPGTIRMAWLNPMIEERFKPIYDEFVARRNVNVGLPADASRDRFAQQMFSNITDGLSYIPGSNIATAGLTLASTLSDTKKEDGT